MDIASINEWLKTTTSVPAKGQAVVKAAEPRQVQPGVAEKEKPSETEASPERIQEAVSSIQEFVQSVRRDINFSLDDSSGRVVVKVTDAQSGDVIRQMPSEEALKLAESLSEARSLLFTAQV
ncbi:flagellar protein FlaG [Ectopseudomonas mendocina]|uniref:Flagellar protein FlaG n=1 Tax=Ectopseudomonas mendocina TaxID=300 RepID=A0ABD7RYV2_ECTME|nr:flagellar protein FlaG [Pseudomonas mendocina]TRO07467.1 flagellar protein FlaG [Pseudomonas mendocina]TRO16529.1 flagellar protein FlaG [Pseudomonas mendocina]